MLERTPSSLRLLSHILSRAQLVEGGAIIWSSMTQSTQRQFQASDDDREGIIDQLFLTQGIEVAVLFIELKDGSTKISFRSHGSVDVASFARGLTEHGGGHLRAAGANVNEPIDSTIRKVLAGLKSKVPASF